MLEDLICSQAPTEDVLPLLNDMMGKLGAGIKPFLAKTGDKIPLRVIKRMDMEIFNLTAGYGLFDNILASKSPKVMHALLSRNANHAFFEAMDRFGFAWKDDKDEVLDLIAKCRRYDLVSMAHRGGLALTPNTPDINPLCHLFRLIIEHGRSGLYETPARKALVELMAHGSSPMFGDPQNLFDFAHSSEIGIKIYESVLREVHARRLELKAGDFSAEPATKSKARLRI